MIKIVQFYFLWLQIIMKILGHAILNNDLNQISKEIHFSLAMLLAVNLPQPDSHLDDIASGPKYTLKTLSSNII